MIFLQKQELPPPRKQNRVEALLFSIGSVKIGVVLIGILAVVLICATLLETKKGMEFTNWYVYKSTWFIVLLAVFCINILAGVLIRYPWKNRWGFLLAHCGILVLLLGAMLTFWAGIDEQLALAEGEKTDSIQLSEWSKFVVFRKVKPDETSPQLSVFSFQPGPFDWPEGKTYDGWKEINGIKLRVLKYLSHARLEEDWSPAQEKQGMPAIRFAIATAEGKSMVESWLSVEPLGGPGLPQLDIMPAPLDSMREDFLNPPNKEEDPDGVLSVHFDGRMQRIPVSKNLGKRITLEGSKIEVEIVNYYANAKLRGTAQFESLSDEPKNPILELKIYLPEQKDPLRELAFAKSPLMSLTSMHGKSIPVRFWYHQPSYQAPPGIDFLQTPDGKLYCRTSSDGKYVSQGEVKTGSSIEIAQNINFKILEYLPFAERKVIPHPIEPGSGEKNLPGPAAQVEVESDGVKQSVWLVRNNQKYGSQPIYLPKETLRIEFEDETMPLGFALQLLKFTREMNPGRMGDAAFSSSVQLVDKTREIDQTRDIRMNQPLTYDKFTFYQSGFNELERGEKVSILRVTYDPGRFLKYLGSLMLCLGIALRYITNAPSYKKLRQRIFPVEIKGIQALVLYFLLISPAIAGTPPESNFDWGPWRYLPVQEDGRQKPLDTLARESLWKMSGRTDVTNPETGQSLDAVAFYMAKLFDWQGWDQPSPHPPADDDLPTAYFRMHKPDKWDQAALFCVDSKELRKALGIPANQRNISPYELSRAKISDTETSRSSSFLEWAETLARSNKNNPSYLEKKGVELANHFEEYLADRMGYRLEILPLKDNPHQQWASLAMLMQAELDDKIDPDGALRKAKDCFLKARAAYRKPDAKAFAEASAGFINSLKTLGPDLGSYPSAEIIDLEIAYNHHAPFRIAWILSLIALACVLASKLVNSKFLHACAWLIFFAGLMAMVAGFSMRSAIGHRAPITNMYESVLSVAVGIALLGLIYELINRNRYLLIAASVLSSLVIIFAESCPTICDPRIRPLMPVLRSNFLLWIHVVPIMFSYAAFAVAWILANISLGGYLSGRSGTDFMNALSKLMLKIIRIGVFLLAVGTILGGYWADLSWGRFWGWDPKEVWALITLLFYVGILHARYIGWLADFGTAVWAVISFLAVIMTWYGVNFVLGTGMHSYGSGTGGVGYYVVAGLIVQCAYVLAAAFIHYTKGETLDSPGNISLAMEVGDRNQNEKLT